MTTLRKGQRVTVTGPAGRVAAQVIAVEEPRTLPHIARPAPDVDTVRSILAELDVEELALIEHDHAGKRVAFFALRDTAGRWWDLQRQPLTVEPLQD